jgi:hypothetical protein
MCTARFKFKKQYSLVHSFFSTYTKFLPQQTMFISTQKFID